MEHAAGDEEVSIESEFAATIHFIDLYLRQKTDLFLQHYVFEPFDFLAEKFVYLSLLVTLLAAGTLVVVVVLAWCLCSGIVEARDRLHWPNGPRTVLFVCLCRHDTSCGPFRVRHTGATPLIPALDHRNSPLWVLLGLDAV